MDEHRASRRRRVLLGAKLVYADGAISVDCALRDLSSSGARITLKAEQALPNELFLLDLREGVAYEATVVWRRVPDVGLAFRGSHPLRTAASPKLHRLRQIWVDAAARAGLPEELRTSNR